MKDEPGKSKQPKHTASFNIRRRTRSLKDKHKLPSNLPPAELEGLLERKQELQAGGKKATIRSWKSYYAVLFGQLLCFFKDREGENSGRTNCKCDTVKKIIVEYLTMAKAEVGSACV